VEIVLVVIAAAAAVVCADFEAKVDKLCGPVLVGYLLTPSVPEII
jgi:hypothetical protein